jgi:hypothetical protein
MLWAAATAGRPRLAPSNLSAIDGSTRQSLECLMPIATPIMPSLVPIVYPTLRRCLVPNLSSVNVARAQLAEQSRNRDQFAIDAGFMLGRINFFRILVLVLWFHGESPNLSSPAIYWTRFF